MPLEPARRRDLLQLRATLAGLAVDVGLIRIERALARKYRSDQPRAPAGQPDGGRWIGDGSGAPVRDVDTTGSISQGGLPASQTEEVVTEDGSRVLSIRIRANPHAEWDEQHTVTAPDGTRTVFETSGLTQTIRDGETGEILARNTLTPSGAEPEAFVQKVGARTITSRNSTDSLRSALIALYNSLAKLVRFDDDKSRDVYVAPITVYQTNPNSKLPGFWAGRLKQSELRKICPREGEVQSIADRMAAQVRNSGIYLTPQNFGTRVHQLIAEEINARKDSNFFAEKFYADPVDEDPAYVTSPSVIVDVFERSNPSTVCVYDHKTGKKGLTPKRAAEIAFAVQRNFPATRTIVIIEIRPK